MKKLLFNTRISAKVGVFSGLAVLLVIGMIALQIRGDAIIQNANERASAQHTIVKDAIQTEVNVRGMQLSVRDLRLAHSVAELERARDQIGARQRAANAFAQEMLKLSTSPENRERIQKVKALVDKYATATNEILAVRRSAVEIETRKPAGGGTDLGRRADALRLRRLPGQDV